MLWANFVRTTKMFSNVTIPNLVFFAFTVFSGALATQNLANQPGSTPDNSFGAASGDEACYTQLYASCALANTTLCGNSGSGVTASWREYSVWREGSPGSSSHEFKPSEGAWQSCYYSGYPYPKIVDCGSISKECRDRNNVVYRCTSKLMTCKK